MCKCLICKKEIKTQKQFFDETCHMANIEGASHQILKSELQKLNLIKHYSH